MWVSEYLNVNTDPWVYENYGFLSVVRPICGTCIKTYGNVLKTNLRHENWHETKKKM